MSRLPPDVHATLNRYNLVIIDCCCDTSETGDSIAAMGGARKWYNIVRLCVNGDRSGEDGGLQRSFNHELAHMLGSQHAYARKDIGGGLSRNAAIPGWEGNILADGDDVSAANFEHLFGKQLIQREASMFRENGWDQNPIMPEEEVKENLRLFGEDNNTPAQSPYVKFPEYSY